jgi:WD40 repeat protein
MKVFRFLPLMLLAFSSGVNAQTPIYFEDAVAPILRKNCIACHNATLAESGLNLETPAKIMQGGDAGAAIDNQNIGASLLITRATGAVEPIMPPADNTVGASPLTAEQVEIIRAWIAGGSLTRGETNMLPIEMKLPETARASFAVTASKDGDTLAFGRGGSIFVFDARQLSPTQPATAKVDPTPVQTIANAHSDYIHSMATSNDGQYMATGSTGQVKLWKKQSMSFEASRKAMEAAGTLSADAVAAKASTQQSVRIDEKRWLLITNRTIQALAMQSPEALEPNPQDALAIAINASGPVDMIVISPDKTKLATGTWDDAKSFTTIQLWSIAESKLIGPIQRSRLEQSQFLSADRLAKRQQMTIDRIAKSLVDLEKAVQAEATAVTQAREMRDKVAKTLADKEAEKAAAAQMVADHEKMMADTKAAVEAATKQLETLTAELEPKKKKVTDIETQATEIKKQVDVANQTVAGTEQSQQAAVTRVEMTKQLSAQRTEELTALQSNANTLKVKSDTIRLKANALAFANDRMLTSTFTDPSNNTSYLDIFATDTLERFETQQLERQAPPAVLAQVALTLGSAHWVLDKTFDSPKWIADRVTALAFDPSGKHLAIGSGLPSRSGRLAIVNIADGQLVAMPTAIQAPAGNGDADLHSDTILGLAYSPDSKWLASCGADKMTKLIDVASNTVTKVLEGHTHHVLSLAWQEDSFRLATASADATVKVWDIERGEAIQTIAGFGTEVTALTFVGISNQIFTSTINNTARLHDINNGQLVRQYGPAADSLYGVDVVPTGKFAMAVGQEGVLRVWAVDDGRLVAELK